MNNTCYLCEQDFPIDGAEDLRTICPACGGCGYWCGREHGECYNCGSVGAYQRKGAKMSDDRIEKAIEELFKFQLGFADRGTPRGKRLHDAWEDWRERDGLCFAGNPNVAPAESDHDVFEGDLEYQRGLADALMAVDAVLARALDDHMLLPRDYERLRKLRDNICRLPQWREAGVEPPAVPGDMRRDTRRK
jgi:hypothetical protein